MNIKEITKLLGVETLDESLVSEIETKLSALIESKVNDKVSILAKEKAEILAKSMLEGVIEDEKQIVKDELVSEYEEKFENYKVVLAEKFSLFVDGILAEKLRIPENVKAFARKGELYSDLIDQFKIRLGIDEGLVTEEAKEILSEAKDEILKLRNEKNSLTNKILEGKLLLSEASVALYLHDKCQGLTERQKDQVFSILEGVTDKDTLDSKFDIILESLNEADQGEVVNIQVVDPAAAIKDLKKAGVSAKKNKKEDDEIVVNLKDKKKVVAWMLKDGDWDMDDIESMYPSLVESRGTGKTNLVLTEEENTSFVTNYLNYI